MAASLKCIFLTGAPASDRLEWNQDGMISQFDTPVRRFIGGPEDVAASSTTVTQLTAKWRILVECSAAECLTGFMSFDQSKSDGLINDHLFFLEHSLDVINELASSPLGPPDTTVGNESSVLTATSVMTSLAATSFASHLSSLTDSAAKKGSLDEDFLPQSTPLSGSVTDLKCIPNANHIIHMQPQTLTVNLIASVISVAPARTVQLRKRNVSMDIVELLLGDETRSGFCITFWLTPSEKAQCKPASDDLRETLKQLRAGAVVMVQNVALSAFKGCVYGQSLSRHFARNSTKIVSLSESVRVPVEIKAKLRRVKVLSGKFIGREGVPTAKGGAAKRPDEAMELPPQTQ